MSFWSHWEYQKTMHTVYAVGDTGSGYNVIHKDCLPLVWQGRFVRDAPLPNLRDANGNPLPVTHVVELQLLLYATFCTIFFVVVDSLSCILMWATDLLNYHVDANSYQERIIIINDEEIPIVDSGTTDAPCVANAPIHDKTIFGDATANRIRICRPLTLAPFSPVRARVKTCTDRIVRTDPKHSMYEPFHVQSHAR